MMQICYGQLSITKKTNSEDFNVGDELYITLVIENKFDKEITARIIDENVISNNGIKVNCLDLSLQPNQVLEYNYEPIELFEPGTYTLGSATVSNGIDNATSNMLDINVKGESLGAMQGITEIYNCNGISSTSKSFSSGGTNNHLSVSLGGFGSQNNLNTPTNRPQIQSAPSINNDERELIESDEKYLKLEKELNDQGFIMQDLSITPINESDKQFVYTFKNGDNVKYLTGNLLDDKIIDITVKVDTPVATIIIISLILIILITIIGISLYPRFKKKEPPNEHIKSENIENDLKENFKSINKKSKIIGYANYVNNNRSVYDNDPDLFFEKLSQKIKEKYGKKELTNKEVLEKVQEGDRKRIRILLDLCEDAIYAKEYSNYESVKELVGGKS